MANSVNNENLNTENVNNSNFNIQDFLEDSLILLTKQTLDVFLSQKNPADLIALYTFYYYTAKWQRTNQPRCTASYVAKGIHWGTRKVKKVKKQLKEFGLINDVKVVDPKTKKVLGHYIKINYIFKEKTKNQWYKNVKQEANNSNNKAIHSSGSICHPVENSTTNALSVNNKNKDIYSLSSNESKEYISLGQIQKKQNLAVKNKTKKENKKAISSIENDLEKEFLESFWSLYPKKEHKIDAKKAFFKARKTGSKLETIVQGLKNYIAYWQNDNRPKKYIPHAATWLNGKMWVDDCLKQETHTSYDINEYVKTMDTFDCNYIKPNRPAQNTDEYLDKLLDGCFIKKSESNDESQVEDHIQFLDSS